MFQADTHNGQLHPEISKRPRRHLVTKSFPSVFTGTDLAGWFARHEIDTLNVAGYPPEAVR
ncbi:isochorismatase family protein [Variovorax sp. NFACC27]|mgnify:CR=1 FL=1|uniref:isochorismatase family protein n=1 Tax=unclassified Variovorax TaxID=663243 RepID=UPI00089D1142|nr:Isochorismatase family protein [Variovorax sp. NFACC28]SEG98129.1 Isochorismatase family protein [Variovorax sp. NFACC29]SFE04821.1 Isochorismatase family protein [Variovorax sp. NFACC26]SFH12914.1 Isochorismatase family protein [Variovorax sp. NFACC27]